MESILSIVVGPAGAVAVLFLILYWIYKLTDKHILPAVKEWFLKQDEKFERIMKEHADDRKVFRDSIEVLASSLKATDAKVDRLVDEVEEIKDDIKIHIKREEDMWPRSATP